MKKRKLVALLAAAAMFVTMGTGCMTTKATDSAGSGSGDGKTEITFYTYNLSIASQKEAAQKLIDDFNAQSDTVHVTGVAADVMTMQTKIQSDYAAGQTFDVVQCTLNQVGYYVDNYKLPAFEDVAGQAAFDEHMEGFAENAKTLGQYRDGKTYVLPYTFSTPMLYYNADLFRDAGLDPDAPIETWDDVKECGLALKAAGHEGVQITATGDGSDWLIQAMIYSNGGDVMNEDHTEVTFTDPNTVGAISMWQDLVKSGAHTNYTDTEAQEAFLAGNQGMLVTTAALESGLISAAESGGWELKAAPFPSFEGKESVPTNSGSGLCIMSSDPEKQAAAWEFIKYVTSAEGYTTITSMMGYLPLRPDIVNNERYLKSWAEEHPFVHTNLAQLERLHRWEGFPGMNGGQIGTLLNQTVTKCIFTDCDVASEMQTAQSQAQDLMP